MTLKGEGSSRLKEACIAFGSCMLMMAKLFQMKQKQGL